MKYILVTGGAGYIGSHCVRALKASGHAVVVVDNLSNGHAASIIDTEVELIHGDIGDERCLTRIFKKYEIDSVVHFAAFAYVGESVEKPLKYYKNNLASSLVLLGVMESFGCKKIVFSSTCATYGIPENGLISESDKQEPINPYGASKLMLERVINDCGRAWGLRSVFLRYFNACGCSHDGLIGEDHRPETHLIPKVLFAARGDLSLVEVYGDDYETDDGTCVRDFIHVEDLASAHLKALEYLIDGGVSKAFNLGVGRGVSVNEVIAAARRVTRREIPAKYLARREGDPPYLVSDSSDAALVLKWQAEYSDIDYILQTAWSWFTNEEGGRYSG